jgi:hypothetical protein
MLARSTALVILLATQVRAVDSDFRAGLWEGTIERGKGVEKIVLLLTISVQARDGPNAAVSAVARIDSGFGVCGSNDAVIEPNRVSFECIAIRDQPEVESATGHFEGYFSPRSNLVTGTWRGQIIQLTRPPQTNSLLSEDWVAEGGGDTCVVRFFDRRGSQLVGGGRVTIDIYSNERAVFGKLIGANVSGGLERRLILGWADTDKNVFLGKLEADGSELTGLWQGRDFLCGTRDHKATFYRTRSSL